VELKGKSGEVWGKEKNLAKKWTDVERIGMKVLQSASVYERKYHG
jgi:hypothetical protein